MHASGVRDYENIIEHLRHWERSGEISIEYRRIKRNCINKRLERNKYEGLETRMLRNEMAWLLYSLCNKYNLQRPK